MSHAKDKPGYPPQWFCDLIQLVCDKYLEVVWGEDPFSKTPDNVRKQPTGEFPWNHCFWLMTADGVEVFDGDEMSLEQLERAWPLQAAKQAVLLNMYPGVVGRCPAPRRSEGFDEWSYWAEPRVVRFTAGALEGETFGPLFGWESVESFMTVCEDIGIADAWDSFEPASHTPGAGGLNPYTRLRDLLS